MDSPQRFPGARRLRHARDHHHDGHDGKAKDLSPSTTTVQATSPADTPRQIVVEETSTKTGEVITVAKGEDAVPKPAEAKLVADAEVHNTAQAPAAEAASAP